METFYLAISLENITASDHVPEHDVPPSARFLCLPHIPAVCLPSLNLNKTEYLAKVSTEKPKKPPAPVY